MTAAGGLQGVLQAAAAAQAAVTATRAAAALPPPPGVSRETSPAGASNPGAKPEAAP